jgi:uncharacterized protein YbjT (DUF2867 family)
VTGGSGFLGVHCVARALAVGHPVRTTVRSRRRESEVPGDGEAGGNRRRRSTRVHRGRPHSGGGLARGGRGRRLCPARRLPLGPVLGPDFSSSIGIVKGLLDGAMPALPRIGFGMVDVRDVADLHLRATGSRDAAGERFIAVAGEPITLPEIARIPAVPARRRRRGRPDPRPPRLARTCDGEVQRPGQRRRGQPRAAAPGERREGTSGPRLGAATERGDRRRDGGKPPGPRGGDLDVGCIIRIRERVRAMTNREVFVAAEFGAFC